MDMIHAKLRNIIESNPSEEGVSSCSSVAGDEIHDSGVSGSFSWFRSEEARSGFKVTASFRLRRLTVFFRDVCAGR